MNSVQSVTPLKVNIGGQLGDHEIIGREAVIATMSGYLARGMNLVINDPRRIGKSAALQLLEAASSKQASVIKTSVQNVHSLEQFLVHLLSVLHEHQSLSRRARQNVADFVDTTSIGVEVEGIQYGLNLNRRHRHKDKLTILDEVVQAINDSLDDGQILVLAVDEFTEAIINIATAPDTGRRDATQLLQTLQRLRKDHGRVRWVLTGSVGMHHALRWTDCTASVVSGDCKNVPVGPLSIEDAEYLSHCLAVGEGIDLTSEARTHLAQSVDGIPILVHAIIDDLRNQGDQKTFGPSEVEAAIERYISDNDESRTFEHFVTRLETYYAGEELAIARALLDRTASRTKPYKTAKVTARVEDKLDVDPELVRQVLMMIIDDHYLVRDGKRLRWRYPVLARVWRAKRGLG